MKNTVQKFLVGAFAIVLISALSMPNSLAAVKAGGSCSKKGITAKAGSQIFTCTAKGKKLTWVLIKPVTKPTKVDPTSTTSTSGTSSTQETRKKIVFTSLEGDACKSGDVKVGYSNSKVPVVLDCGPDSKLHPMANGKLKVDEYSGRAEYAYNFSNFPSEVRTIFTNAWREVRDGKSPGTPITFNISYQSDVPTSHREIFEASARVMNENYAGWAKNTREVYWIVATEKSWAIDQIKILGAKLGATQGEIDSYVNTINNGTIRFKNYSDPLILSALAQSTGQNGRLAGKPVQIFDSWPTYQGNPFDWHEATHEVFHPLVEDYILPARTNQLPCWYTEGSASLIGESFGPAGMTFESQFTRYLTHGGGRTGAGFTWGGDLEFPGENNCSQHSQVYTEGEAITTFLVGIYGWEKFTQFIKVPAGSDWKSNFKNVYGVPVEDFYTRIQPMMKDIYSWLDKQ